MADLEDDIAVAVAKLSTGDVNDSRHPLAFLDQWSWSMALEGAPLMVLGRIRDLVIGPLPVHSVAAHSSYRGDWPLFVEAPAGTLYALGTPMAKGVWPPILGVIGEEGWWLAYNRALDITNVRSLPAEIQMILRAISKLSPADRRAACKLAANALYEQHRDLAAEPWDLLSLTIEDDNRRAFVGRCIMEGTTLITDVFNNDVTAAQAAAITGWEFLTTAASIADVSDAMHGHDDVIRAARIFGDELRRKGWRSEALERLKKGAAVTGVVIDDPGAPDGQKYTDPGVDQIEEAIRSLQVVAIEPRGLRALPIIDGWSFVLVAAGKLVVTGVVSGAPKFGTGDPIRTSLIAGIDAERTFVKTQNSVYHLGWPAVDIEGASIWPPAEATRTFESFAMAIDFAAKTTKPMPMAIAGIIFDPDLWLEGGMDEKREACRQVASALVDRGRLEVAKAWYLLASRHAFARVVDGPPSRRPKVIVPGGDAEGEGGVVVLERIVEPLGKSTIRQEFKAIEGKRLPVTPVPDVAAMRAALVAEFPYAMTQIDVLLTDLVGAKSARFRPTILVGKPGCGKSRLARRLGELSGLYISRYDAAGAGDNSFSGTARRWSSGEASVPVRALRDGEKGDCCIILDELEKCASGRQNGSFADSILPFLERETAMRYPDPYLQAAVDCSRVSYIATANSVDGLPAPLRDRFRILRIPAPTKDDLPSLCRGIVADLIAESGEAPEWVPMLDDGEMWIASQLWSQGGSVRRLRDIVGRIIVKRREMRH